MPESMFSGGELCSVDSERLGCAGIVFVVAGLAVALVAYYSGRNHGSTETQQEAVQHGAARWIVTEDGEREFVWNEGAGDAE